jgi:hypothetical protein
VGKKMHIHKDDEVRYIFTPTRYNRSLKHILLWTSFGKEERAWANMVVGLVGLFEIEWKTP